jgi:hypothetical protein
MEVIAPNYGTAEEADFREIHAYITMASKRLINTICPNMAEANSAPISRTSRVT